MLLLIIKNIFVMYIVLLEHPKVKSENITYNENKKVARNTQTDSF